MGITTEVLLRALVEHLELTAAALALATLIGVPLGIHIARARFLAGPVLAIVSTIQTVPSVALLGFLIPLLGIGMKPAIVVLFSYSLLPIVRNTYTGLIGVDAAAIEAARGIGMRDGQILMRVTIPQALPVLMAGIRTATVLCVGVTTVAALIGAGGLGSFIFRGIAMLNTTMILAGAVPAALLALVLDLLLAGVERWITPAGLRKE
ncbi:MAG TPA: ABC transporter permease [Labilithrix sp.]|jgi:osmoprotectant transport system permease protein